MKTTILLICLSLSLMSFTDLTQTVHVKGTTVEKQGEKTTPLIGVSLSLLDKDSTEVTGNVSDEKGGFNLSAPSGDYLLRFSFIGFQTQEIQLKNLVKDIELGEVEMKESAVELSGVTVNGNARTAKIDRDVYVITKELKSGVTLSRDLLGRLNGVVYNPYDQSISVNGKTNILILVDGIEKDQNMAKTMSPDRIDRVEVVKDPTGKYASDGYSAVINIITKKDYAGIDVNVNANPMFNFFNKDKSSSPYIQGNGSTNIQYSYNKISLYGGFYSQYGSLHIPSDYTKRYGDLLISTLPIDYKHPNATMKQSWNAVWLGGSYFFSADNSLSIGLNYNNNFNKPNMSYDLSSYRNQTLLSTSHATSLSHNTGDDKQATLTYNGKWGKNSTVEADFRYKHSTPTNSSTYIQDAINSTSANKQKEDYYRLNLDYTYQFVPSFSMNLGYGSIIDNQKLLQNDSTLKQNQLRNRVWLYGNWAPSTKWNMKVGGIVEFYNQTYQGEGLTYTAWMPFANIQYKPLDNLNLIAKYHAWSPAYPNIGQLSPFTAQMDSLSWSVGNPALQPSNSQEVSLEINLFKRFRIEPYYDFDPSNMQQYHWENSGQYYLSTVNANKWRKYGVSASFNYQIKKPLIWQFYANLNNTEMSYNGISNQQFAYQFNTFFYYSLEKLDGAAGIGMQKNIFKNAMLQGYSNNNNDIVLIMLQKNFFKKRLSCSFIYMPPVKLFVQYEMNNVVNTPAYSETSRMGVGLLKNIMMLQINYHFSSGKQVNVKKSSLDNEQSAPKQGGGLFGK
jgi:hypothetical protein